VALVDQPARPVPPGFATDALRSAATLGAELKDLALPKDRAGRTVVNAAAVLRVIRSFRARPVGDPAEDRIPHADIALPPAWSDWTALPGYDPTMRSHRPRSRATPAS
jgi:hypothetical protein